MKTQLVRLTNFGDGGLSVDQIESGLQPGEWSKLNNIDLRSGDIAAGYGYLQLDPDQCPVDPIYLFVVEQAETSYIIVSDGIASYLWDGSNYHVLALGWNGGRVSFTIFLGTVVVNSATDGPFYWDGNVGNPLLALPGWITSARCIRIIAYKNYLIAIGVDDPARPGQDKYLVAWSDVAPTGSIPNDWTPTQNNSAGSRLLQDTSGHLYTAALLRNDLIIYKGDSAYRMSPRQDNLIFNIERIKERIGCDVWDGVAEYGGGHVIVTRGDIVFFDGQSTKSIAFKKVRETLFEILSRTEWQETRVFAFYPRSEIWILIKSVGSPDYTACLKFSVEHNAFSVNPLKWVAGAAIGAIDTSAYEKSWDAVVVPTPDVPDLPPECNGIQDDSWDCGPPISWNISTYNPSRDEMLFGSRVYIPGATPEDPDIISKYQLWRSATDTYTDFNNKPLYNIAEKTGIIIGEIRQRMMLKRVYPELEGDSVIQITLGEESQVGAVVRWTEPKLFRAGTDQFVNFRNIAQPNAIRIESIDGLPWRLLAISFEFQPTGRR